METTKTTYQAPEMEQIAMRIECGFAVSDPTTEVDHNDYSGGGWE
jgi:hypothetical protein